MDNNLPEKEKEKGKVAPSVNNDQLGENASAEFAQQYDNKSNRKASFTAKNQTPK